MIQVTPGNSSNGENTTEAISNQVDQAGNESFSLEGSLNMVTDKLMGWWDAIILKLPNFVLAIILFIVFWFLAKYLGRLADRLMRRAIAQDSIRDIARKFIKIVIIMIGFFIALAVLNLDKVLTTVLGAAGVVGLAIGLAVQGVLNNTFSGVILSFLPRVQVGDWISVNDVEGEILEITLRSMIIKKATNNVVMIPNSTIMESAFENYSQTDRKRIMIECGVGYESDLKKVRNLTMEMIKKKFPQSAGEEVEFYYQGFGGSSIDYVLRFWADAAKKRDIHILRNEAILAIDELYKEHDINIPFPIRTLDFDKNKFRAETLNINQSQE